MTAELREPEEDRTLVIDDAGTLSLHLPCNRLGIVIGPRHVHPRSSACVMLCDEAAHHMVRCDDVAGHVGAHRARYHSGAGWPVGYFTETLEAPTSSSEVGAPEQPESATTEPVPSTSTVAPTTDTRPVAIALGFVLGLAGGLVTAACFLLWVGVI